MDDKALLADGFAEALIGMGRQYTQEVAVYDYIRCVEILMERDGMDYSEACEYMEHNVVGAWVGKGTPVFIDAFEEEE